jgi:hypothetical protein
MGKDVIFFALSSFHDFFQTPTRMGKIKYEFGKHYPKMDFKPLLFGKNKTFVLSIIMSLSFQTPVNYGKDTIMNQTENPKM